MKERVKRVRKEYKLNQTEFAESLGLSKSHLSKFEVGYANLSDRTINDICRIYKVNENWLRTGEGEPYANRTRNQEIADFINEVMEESSEDFKKNLIFALTKLDSKDWEVLAKIADKIKNAE